ncbi:ScbA/BarX family gamma-butyrolactone biosynthesis protein [Streptomyces sp. NPDC029674]|uniref:ScbA/BarX family gamma-butyrolactone biosynthesis protein n=1 Tax=Streptomyces sp. NPDC029674 TaxID=3365297 RepID=UPI00384AA49E
MSSSLVLPESKDGQGNRSHTARTDGSPAQLPRLTTTVPAEYVHRAALAEVFLTDCEKTGENTFVLTGQWPRAHTFFNTSDGRHHDHLQACETLRQTGIYLAHAEFGIPLGHHFVMQDMTVTTHPEHLAIGTAPTNLILNTTLTRTRRGANFTISLTITNQQHDTVSTGYGHFTCISPAAYRRLRSANPTNSGPANPTAHTLETLEHIPTQQNPATYGRVHARDLVLAPTHEPHRYRLNPDPAHPILFDHDGDHIPGMVLIEASRQATHPHPPATHLTHSHTEWHHYVELSSPCHITTTPPITTITATGHTTTHTVTSHQNNHSTHTTTLTHTTTSASTPT